MDYTLARIVGHRGYPERYPENTLSGIEAAVKAGLHAVEFDIQASRDGHPIVFHDEDLQRVTGVKGALEDYDVEVLSRMSAHEPGRFNDEHLPESIACLEDVVNLLADYPQAHVFAEVKPEIFKRFSRQNFLPKVWRYLSPLKNHCTIISSDVQALQYIKDECAWPIGWVIYQYNSFVYDDALKLSPDFLISNIKRLPEYPDRPWEGPWSWFVYDIVDANIAKQCMERGIYYIESWDGAKLMQDLDIKPIV